MKLISYNPNEVENIPIFFNKSIDEAGDEKYIMFVFNDIIDKAKDKDALMNAYQNLLERLDIPYAFFPYYIHFNRILNDSVRIPSPRVHVNLKNELKFDVVQEPAYGMLVLNVEKLKSINFKFNENYKKSFYIQDLIKACFDSHLYYSGAFFLDVYKSYMLFDSDFKDGIVFPAKAFIDEKKQYFDENKPPEPEKINDFVKSLKDHYGTNDPTVITVDGMHR